MPYIRSALIAVILCLKYGYVPASISNCITSFEQLGIYLSLVAHTTRHSSARLDTLMDSNNPTVFKGVPAAKPPPGVVPNYSNPYSDGPTLIIVGSLLLFIMLVCVGARIFTKVKITRRTTPDDCRCPFILLDMVLTAVDTCVIAAVNDEKSNCSRAYIDIS